MKPQFGGTSSTTIPCLTSDPSLVRQKNSLFGITTTAGLANPGVVGSGSSNGNVGAGGIGLANTSNVSRNSPYNQQNSQNSPSGGNIALLNARPVHGGGQPYRGQPGERQVNQGITTSGNDQGFYRPPPRQQQHGGFHGHHSQHYDNYGNDQGITFVFYACFDECLYNAYL